MAELVELAWPIAAGMLGETALGLCDTKLVGALGPAALAGVGVAWTMLLLFYALVFGGMRGVKVRAAYAVGRGRGDDAVRYAEAGALIGVVAGVLVFAATRDLGGVLAWLGVDASVIPYAKAFIAARAYGAVGTCAGAALIQYLQGVGDSRSPMVVGLAGNVLNAGLAYALIHGRFGLPALGVRGAGYATATTEVLELLALAWVVQRRVARAPKPALGRAAALREVAALGVPTGLHFVLEAAAFTTFTTILGSMRPAEMAAHMIALNVIRASFLPGVAVSEAASVLVARALGQRSLREADRVARAALTLGVGFMSLCGLGFALFGASLAAAFSDEPEVVAIARKLLLVAAVFQTLDAVNMILRGALRGAKDVRWVAVVGTTVAWISIPGAALVLGRIGGLGALGGWLGFVLETSLASALLWRRWSRGPWRAAYGAQAAEKEEEAPLSAPAPIG
jgi:MATE family multidrug resistance protein